MRYVLILLLLLPAYYLFSYARYTWKDSKISSLGSAILAIISIVFPAVVIILR